MLRKILRNPEGVAKSFRFDRQRRNPFRVATSSKSVLKPRVAAKRGNPGLQLANAFSVRPGISCQVSDVRRSGSSRPPFIFIDATDEEPQDHDYHIQQGPDRGHHEHARAERGIEISEPA